MKPLLHDNSQAMQQNKFHRKLKVDFCGCGYSPKWTSHNLDADIHLNGQAITLMDKVISISILVTLRFLLRILYPLMMKLESILANVIGPIM